jgi:hypothetical protein
MVSDLKDKISPEQGKEIEEAKTGLRTALGGEDVSYIKTQTDALKKIMEKIGAAMYQQGQQASGQQGSADAGQGQQGAEGQSAPGADQGAEGGNDYAGYGNQRAPGQ